MIERYTRPEMAALWSDENKFHTWLEIELLACEAHGKLGIIPGEAVAVIRHHAKFDIARIDELERTLNHDVIAFLTSVAENVGEESRHIHLGMTSSDVVDTGLSVLIRQSGLLLRQGLEALRDTLARRALEFRSTVMIGRTHGIHAEPTTFGLKLALWYEETKRNIERLDRAIETVSFGKISGAVGTYAHIDPFVEEYVCQHLNLKPSPVSTQVLQRDRHAEFMGTLAVIAGSLEKFATEIRHLQRTEVLEAEEYFAKGQKGSSAMPHKRNPITCERVAGMARLIRGYAQAAFENQALWHERDITHSSVERVILPDATTALDYMLHKMLGIMDNLIVYPQNMQRNLELTRGLIFSQQVLLALIQAGMLRETAYAIVQNHAMRVWREDLSLLDSLLTEPEIPPFLSAEKLVACFSLTPYLRHIDMIFARLGLHEEN